MDALKRASAKSVNLIVPHFAYGRQDKKSAPREPITARLIADLLDSIGFDRLITMDLHSDQIQGFFSQPVDHLTALPIIADYINQKSLANLVVVAPDAGRVKFSKRLADRLHASLAMMYKTRPAQQVAKITNVIGDVKDKTILLVDDMIDTAGSVISGIEALKASGCGDVYLAATHPVFSGPAIERLSEAPLKEVIVTNTMALDSDKHFDGLTVLSAAPLLAEAIRRNYQRRSISSLFN
jgi:ribose-phosphate pyrophosphokinase